jgi:altronate dehydratase large subunit
MTQITGYVRPNGAIGIRNHVLVLATVSCVTGVIRRIAWEVPEAVCVPHAWGCGRGGLRDVQVLLRVLSGMVHHPNIGAVVLVGLGCEVSNTRTLTAMIGDAGKPVEIFNVQEDGGSLATARKAAAAVRRLQEELSRQERVPISWEGIVAGMKCGGSDAMSGVTANVALGAVADWLVAHGGTVLFGENTEMIGTAHVLARRARNAEIAKQIEQVVERAERLAQDIMGGMASLVISPGNMDGGMSTIAEKAMGSICKAGTTTINQVIDYGEAPTQRGLILQDGPGYDGDAMTGLAVSGAQLLFFSTGRGTPAGFPGLPVIKVASNSRVFAAMPDDMDVNAGVVIGGAPPAALRAEMIDLMIRVINGEPTQAERHGMDVFTFMTVHPPF